MTEREEFDFVVNMNKAARRAYDNSAAKGFHDTDAGDAARIALCHSELSEALEALRHGNPPDDKVPEFNGAVVELADCVIRIFDMCEKNKWPIAAAIVSKMAYNEGRPHMHGGKMF